MIRLFDIPTVKLRVLETGMLVFHKVFSFKVFMPPDYDVISTGYDRD